MPLRHLLDFRKNRVQLLRIHRLPQALPQGLYFFEIGVAQSLLKARQPLIVGEFLEPGGHFLQRCGNVAAFARRPRAMQHRIRHLIAAPVRQQRTLRARLGIRIVNRQRLT